MSRIISVCNFAVSGVSIEGDTVLSAHEIETLIEAFTDPNDSAAE